MRAVRFAARFESAIDPATAEAIRAMASQLPVVSAERIADELRKMLLDRRRARALRLLTEVDLLDVVLPEASRMRGVPQGPPSAPTGDLWDHTLKVMEMLPESASFPLVLAALLHDVGKPATMGRTPERYTFHAHEHVGRQIAADVCERLKLSNAERDRICWLVERHQYLSEAPTMRPSRLKPVLAHPGIEELLTLHRADAAASGRAATHVEFAETMLREWTASGALNPPPLLTGDDLAEMGIPQGPVYKRLLDAVREGQLDGTLTTALQARELVRRMIDNLL
jgi:poly(A) polymerase